MVCSFCWCFVCVLLAVAGLAVACIFAVLLAVSDISGDVCVVFVLILAWGFSKY